MIYIADTNIVSEIMKPQIDGNVLSWFWDHEGEIFLTSVTIQELYYGVLRMPDGKRKKKLRETIDSIVQDCADETFSYDGFSAFYCAQFHAQEVAAGFTPSVEDMMIAGICKRNEAILATRNTKDFMRLGIPLVNPYEN